MAKIINTILHTDDIDGSKTVEIAGCICKLYVCKRGDEDFLQEYSDEIQSPALYILINRKIKKAYIGQTLDFRKRLAQHSAKSFWNEALSFQATDGSLSSTQVQFLEAKAYELANNANNYDLSENGQIPTEPPMRRAERILMDDFFKNVQFLTKFVGCEVFEQGTSGGTAVVAPIILPEDVVVADGALAGRIKLSLNGEGAYSKSMFPLVVVKEFMKKYPNATFAQLQATFPVSFLSSIYAGWGLLQDNLNYANDNNTRFNKEVLTSSDGHCFRVCNQWEQHSILNILGIVKALKWDFEILS